MATVHPDRLNRPAFTANVVTGPLKTITHPPRIPPSHPSTAVSVPQHTAAVRSSGPQLLQTFQAAPTASVTAIQFCPNRIHALFASASRTLHLINPTAPPPPLPVSASASSAAATVPSPAIRLYHPPHAYDITCIGVSRSSQHLLSGSSDRQLIITQTETAHTLRKIKAHELRINALAVSGDNVCATASADSTVRLWDLRAMRDTRPLQSLTHSRDSVTGVVFMPSPSLSLLTSSIDGCLRVYDVRRGEVVVEQLESEGEESITSIDVGEYGDVVLAATTASHMLLVDLTTKPAATVLRRYDSVNYKSERYSLQCILVDGGTGVVSGTESSNDLLRWDVSSGRLLESWSGGGGGGGGGEVGKGVSGCVAWEQSSGVLLSGSTNGTVSVWKLPLST